MGFFIDSSNLAINTVTELSETAKKIPVPRSITEAPNGPYAVQWMQAILSELESHAENGTWSLVDPPTDTDRRIVGSMWVFKVQYDQATGAVERFKARLVAHGGSQQFGVDYGETYAPVARFASFRILVALAAHHDLDLEHVEL